MAMKRPQVFFCFPIPFAKRTPMSEEQEMWGELENRNYKINIL